MLPLGEVVLVLNLYPSSVELDCVSIGLVEFGTPVFDKPFVLPRWRLYWVIEEFGTPSRLEILLDEGGDVELGARTSKHILLFAFDPLTLISLSLFVLCIIHIIHIVYACVVPCINSYCLYLYMLGLCLCASLVPNHKSFI